jgi:hypothetical protein
VDEHPGDKFFGKGCHRDPVRSTHSFTALRWGHKWVVLAVLVPFPFTRRQWALPLLVALYGSAADNDKAGRRHKTPAHLLRQLCCVLLRWFGQRQFVLTGDNNYGWHEMARVASQRRGRLHLVSKFYPDQVQPCPPLYPPFQTATAAFWTRSRAPHTTLWAMANHRATAFTFRRPRTSPRLRVCALTHSIVLALCR